MNIEQLRYAVEVARTGSIRQASNNLFLSQPNLSVAIQNLEREIGYPIFRRSSRGMQLTSMGRIFINSSEAVVKQFEQLSQMNQNSEPTQTQSFSVAILPYRYLADTAVRLYQNHSDSPIHLTVKSGSRSEIIDMVHREECEIGILGIYSPFLEDTLHQLESMRIRFVRLGEVRICILVGKSSPLYQLPADLVTREQLKDRCFVGFDEMEFGPYATLPKLLGLGSEHCPQRIYASSWSSILDIVRSTDGFSIVATNRKAYTKVPYYGGVRSLELTDCDCCNVVGWITREGMPLSNLTLEYLSILSNYFE